MNLFNSFSLSHKNGILTLLLLLLMGPLLLTTAQPHQVLFSRAPAQSTVTNPVQEENQLPGTTSWQWTNPASYDTAAYRFPDIEGYALSSSVAPGQTITFAVSTTSPTFRADVYRLGWYQGMGGRLLQSFPHLEGHFYVMPPMDARTGLVDANWPVSFRLTPAFSWVTGIYLVKLTASRGKQGYIPFVVTSLRSAAFVFIHASNTDQAYNPWGGKSLYEYNSTNGVRAYKVSYNRPLATNQLPGYGNLLYWEYPMLRWLERNGYDVQYVSSVDTSTNANIFRQHKGILIVGHNEYWTKDMRDHLERAVQQGVNLANFAADTMYWQVRYEPDAGGRPNRIIVCYKDPGLDPLRKYLQPDPQAGKDNAHVTVEFRNWPINRPEQALLGSMSNSYFDSSGFPWVVNDPSVWVLAGTGLKKGARLPGLVGYEYDTLFNDYPQPPADRVVAASPVVNIYGIHEYANSTVYTASSGAEVFDAGTLQWSWGLDDFGSIVKGYASVVYPAVQKITANILQRFLAGSPSPAASFLKAAI